MSKNPLCLFVCAAFMLIAILGMTIAPSLALNVGSEPAPFYEANSMQNHLDIAPELRDTETMINWGMGGTAAPFGNTFTNGMGNVPAPQVQMNKIPEKVSPELEKYNTEVAQGQGQSSWLDMAFRRLFGGQQTVPITWWFDRKTLLEGIPGYDGRQAYQAWSATDPNGESQNEAGHTYGAAESANTAREAKQEPRQGQSQTKSNSQAKGGASGSAAGESGKFGMEYNFDMMTNNWLPNVANEATGVPCSSRQPVKSYNNAIWMMQQMYKACYIPMAILFLLPGAVITNTKTVVAFGVLNVKDEDTVNPFSGILRSIIAIFLIPATQLFVSYVIDTANALTYPVAQEVNIPLILFWCYEQVQCFSPDQQGDLIKNLPSAPNVPYRGKFASMPTSGAILEQMTGCDITLLQCFNELVHLMMEGLSIINAFQIVFMCYLFLLGPIAAAFFAWPAGVGRDLFRKAFSTWMDGVVLLALWKFWWNVVLLCMTVRLESEGINIFDVHEIYFCIAFTSMLLFVPFNPFDFKAGSIIDDLLQKAQAQAGKVASGGGGKGSTGGGGAQGPGARGPMAKGGAH